MKRTTLWKLLASALLVAVLLPLFPSLNATEVAAVTTVPPLPYAMEMYGQHHSGIYFTDVVPSIDGQKDDSYVLVDAFHDSSGQYNGVFVAARQDGFGAGEIATEYVPDKMDIYGAYDGTYAYFYIVLETRTGENYTITPKFGFNFSNSQKDALEGTLLPAYEVTEAAGEAGDGANWIGKTKRTTPGNDSSTNYTDYDRNETVFEFRIAWADIAPEGKKPDLDFDRMYTTFVLPFDDGSATGAYWIYGVPNDALLPNGATVGDAFGAEAANYTPNVVNLLGNKVDSETFPAPEIIEVLRTDKNTNPNRDFKVTYAISGAKTSDLAETGLLFTGNTSSLGGQNMTVNTQNVQILEPTLISEEDDVLKYTATFSVGEADYEKFFSLRPFAKYNGDGAPTVYGPYYSNTSSYYDTVNSEFNQYIKILYMGNSFASYFTDELLQMCKAEGIHLTIGRIYYSGMHTHEHWDWLLEDVKASGLKGELKVAGKSIYPYKDNTYSMQDMLHFVEDWDFISVQDHYGIEFTYDEVEPFQGGGKVTPYEAGMRNGMAYYANLYRYLQNQFPDADMLLHQTWAYQLGQGFQNGSATYNPDGSISGGKIEISKNVYEYKTVEELTPEQRWTKMLTKEQQYKQQEAILEITNSISEKLGVPMTPCGFAWKLARADERIGDILCNGKKGEEAGDYYHEGEGGGGQYLNACVWFEMLTGKDARDVTYKPSYSYPLPDERAEALREIAHTAVEEYKKTASWTGQTMNK